MRLIIVLVTVVVVTGMSAAPGFGTPLTLGSLDLFVDAKAHDGDGSADRPFSTIGEALSLARELRETSELPITIDVAPGTYTAGYPGPDAQPSTEVLPLVLDVSKLTVRGQAASNGPNRPKVFASPPLAEDQAVFAIVADDVTIEGIAVRAGLTNVTPGPKGVGIFVDRARDFVLRDVKVTRAYQGVFARLASGEIVDSEFTNNAVGTFIGAGSEELGYPANIRYEANSVSRNCIGGAFFSAGTVPIRRAPFGANGDRILPDAPIPPAPLLEVEVAGSELVGNTPGCFAAALQFFLHLGAPVAGDEAQAGMISASVNDNTMGGTRGHDIAVDSHLDPNPDGSCETTAPVSFTGDFAHNVVSADHSKIFFGFAFRFPGACYVNDSSITVSYVDDELDGFAHDNPAGFGNVLTVNGEPIED